MVGLHALIAEGLGSIPGWETMIPKATQHTRKVKTKTKQKKTKYILYGSIYKFPPTHPYISFEIRCNESMVAKLALCLPLERVPGRNTGGLLGVVIASCK